MTDAPETIDVLMTQFGNMSMCADGPPLRGDGHDRHIQYRRDDLPVRVLPLVWVDRGDAPQFKATTGFGVYYIERAKSGLFNWWTPALRGKIEVRTLDLAKAAAQADHETRIRAALEE